MNKKNCANKPLTRPIRRTSITGTIDVGIIRQKWIYVTDCDGKFYVGQKKKGHFHHSSFLAGGAICAAGGIKVRECKLLEINPNSSRTLRPRFWIIAIIKTASNSLPIDEVLLSWIMSSTKTSIKDVFLF